MALRERAMLAHDTAARLPSKASGRQLADTAEEEAEAAEVAQAASSQLVLPGQARRRMRGKGGGGKGGGGKGGGGSCPLNIVFADRKGRRKLANIKELVEKCNAWSPSAAGLPGAQSAARRALSVNCSMHNFGVGLIKSLPTLWRADILVVSHGADVINGFGLHAGSSVVEVMPVHQKGCPCDMYRRMYTYQGPTVFHYQLTSTNDSRMVSPMPRKLTYHSDMEVPWESLQAALQHIVRTGARSKAYKFRRFPY